ncbi:hypothetical protein HQQ81_12210 [Microbacteriaceae bacterium VKM Ac-2854]|nr:hypothetical protein [Microbacteriaceae bacterium VKM Ac-2854]
MEARDGALAGGLNDGEIDAHAKADALREWAGACGVPLERTIAVAKPLVRDRADLVVDGFDLSRLLPLLGLRS